MRIALGALHDVKDPLDSELLVERLLRAAGNIIVAALITWKALNSIS